MAVGQFVNPQPAAPAGQADQSLVDKWMGFLQNPAVASGMFQFGANMLANVGSDRPFVSRLGVALGDAGGAAGRVQKFMTETGQTQQQLQQGQQRIGIDQQRADQEATNAANTRDYQGKTLALQGRQLDQTATNNQAELALREKELQSNSSYRNLSLQLQREQNALYAGNKNNPRAMALLALQKQALAQLDPTLGDPNADVTSFIDNGMKVIDQMFPAGGPAASSAVPAAPAAVAPNAAPAAGTPTPQSPVPGALPYDEAVGILRLTDPKNLDSAKKYFDQVYGPGEADKALKAK